MVVIAANKLEDEGGSIAAANKYIKEHKHKELVFLNCKNKIQEAKHE